MKAFVVFSWAFVFLWLLCVPSSLGKPLPVEDEEDDYYYPEDEDDTVVIIDDSDELYVPDDEDEADTYEEYDDLTSIDRKKRDVAFNSDESEENAGDLVHNGEGERPVDEQEDGDSDIVEAEAVNIDEEVAEGEQYEEEEESEDVYTEQVEETSQEGEQPEIVITDVDYNGNGGSEEAEDLGFGYPEDDYDYKN